MTKRFLLFCLPLALISCNEDVTPKPSAELRLEYEEADFVRFENDCPYSFEMNDDAVIKGKGNCNFTID